MKIIYKICQIITRFRSNPITKNNLIKSLFNYFFFNITCRLKNVIVYKGIGGVLFAIKKGDAGLVGNLYYGLYEFEDSMFVIHFLRSSDLFLDIGANLGHFSLIASGVAHANSIAIEPIPDTYNRMLEQFKINKLEHKIEVLNLGLADVNSKLYFSADKGTMNRIVDKEYSSKIEVNVVALDYLIKDRNVSLMKIDVEGYEKYVLDGPINTLSNLNLKAIIIELNNSGTKYGVSDEEIYLKLTKLNFQPYKYNPITRVLTKLNSYNKDCFNTIFIRDFDYVENRIIKSDYYKIWNKNV